MKPLKKENKIKSTKKLKGKRVDGVLYLEKGVSTDKFLKFNSFDIPLHDRVNLDDYIRCEDDSTLHELDDYFDY